MKKVLSILLAMVMLCSLFAGCGGGEGVASGEKLADVKFDAFAVGFGKADITPDYTTSISLVGNNDHNTRLSTGVLEPLMATCVAFTDTDGTTVIVFGMDLHGLDNKVTKTVREGIEEQTGVPADHIQFNVNHNHCGPSQGLDSAMASIKGYSEKLVELLIQAGTDALTTRKPAKMYTTYARPENMVYVRHFLKIDGSYEGNGYDNIPKGEFLEFAEKGDNLLQMVKFTREGEKDIILFNWQGHPFTSPSEYYTYLNGCSPAVFRRILLEQADTESVYIMGGSGDSVQHSARPEARLFKDYKEYGQALAKAAMDAFPTFKEAETGKIYYSYNDEYVCPNDAVGQKWTLSAWGFGDFGYVSSPSEIFQTVSMDVRESSPYKYTFFAQLANCGSGGYIPDARAWTYDCYERGPCKVPEGSAEAIGETLKTMINDCFTQSGQTKKEKDEGYCNDYSPKYDGVTYINNFVGDLSRAVPVNNGFYQVTLIAGAIEKTLLVQNQEIAEQILQNATMTLGFSEQSVVIEVTPA